MECLVFAYLQVSHAVVLHFEFINLSLYIFSKFLFFIFRIRDPKKLSKFDIVWILILIHC